MVYNCYENLSLIPYSNVAAYLSRNSSGKNAIFIKGKSGYLLTRQKKEAIANAIRDDIPNAPSNDLIDLSIVEGAPFYIKNSNFPH